MHYQVIFERGLLARAEVYLTALAEGKTTPGSLLRERLPPRGQGRCAHALLELLLQTKRPQIFAESAVAGDGSDWNGTELALLGDISIATPVSVFDDGRHHAPEPHSPPFDGTLVFACGALLANGRGHPTPDLLEVTAGGSRIDQAAYTALYRRRLRPVFAYIQHTARARGRFALVTVPGLGCGQFAGRFAGRMGPLLLNAIASVLQEMSPAIDRIRLVVFDPYNECEDRSATFGATELRVRPLLRSRNPHPQLCRPEAYAEAGDAFAECDLYSVVAWDHVSWPGNDFYAGARATDDGVKAAATDSMRAMTGIRGQYDAGRAMYLPPDGYRTWDQCVARNGLTLQLGKPFIGD